MSKQETAAGRFYRPQTDIYESADAVFVAMEVPGVEKSAIDVRLEKNVLTVTASVPSEEGVAAQGESANAAELEPIYSEYNAGSFFRSFALSAKIDSAGISASVTDGVLSVRLPKAAEAVARRIDIH